MGRGPKPAKGKAKPAVSRTSRKNEDSKVRDLEKRLAEALQREAEALRQLQTSHHERAEAQEQQTATSEILRVIASSPTDVQPVFDAIVQSATRLCDADFGIGFRFDGQIVTPVALHNMAPDESQIISPAVAEGRGVSATRATVAGRAVLDASVVHIHDLREDPEITMPAYKNVPGYRTVLAVPMLRGGRPIGSINVWRREIRPFSEQHIELLKSFADQAVIAIENVRLFKELQTSNGELTAALDTQTATSDILRVISSSPTDVQPVFDAVVESARRLLNGLSAIVTRLVGEELHLSALTRTTEAGDALVRSGFPIPLAHGSLPAQVVRGRAPSFVSDIETDERFDGGRRDVARARGYRSIVHVPMLREGRAIGTIGVTRREAGPFLPDEIALLTTFAAQAVIAIENVRLFTELREKNSALTTAHAQVSEALDQQTATSEILRVISRSPTDVQPVFDTIVASAARLCEADFSAVTRFAAGLLHLVAVNNMSPAEATAYHTVFPRAPGRHFVVGRAFVDARPVHVKDIEADPDYDPRTREILGRAARYRTFLGVPIIRDGIPIGAIGCGRHEMKPFTATQIELVKTFADQAVIAIENVRLFTELEVRNKALTQSLEQQTATAEILQVISRSPTDIQPVFQAIVDSAQRLLRGNSSVMSRIIDDRIELAAYTRTGPTADALLESFFPIPLRPSPPDARPIREGVIGRRVPYNVADTETDLRVGDRGRTNARARGYRSQLVVPMLRQDEAVGTIAVTRAEPGTFTDDEIALLKTFADQAVIAIENVRLFKELEGANRELSVASQHKSEFLANMSHELRTPLNAIIGFSEVLAEKMFGELNEKQEEYSKDIYASGQHLLSLINDILDLSKIEAGRMELELSDFHLPTALDSALSLVRERAGRRGLALNLRVDERLGQMRADERKVRQVVLNLLSNAIKFTPEGGGIEIHAAPKDGFVEVSVTDTGVGIAPEDQGAVFEEFRQVGTADKKVEGTGLGLTLCRKFVELHGGQIWVKSQFGVGSTFTFTIPVRRGE